MPVRVVHPVRVVVDATLLDPSRVGLLADAVEAGVARAAAAGRVRVLDGLPAGTRVRIGEPAASWAGAAVANLTADGRAAVEDLVAAAIRRGVAAAGVADGVLRRDTAPVGGRVEEAADQARLSLPLERYVVPSYRDGRAVAVPISPARPAPDPVVRWATVTRENYLDRFRAALRGHEHLRPATGLLGALWRRAGGDYYIGAVRFPGEEMLPGFALDAPRSLRFAPTDPAEPRPLDPQQVYHLRWRGPGSQAESIVAEHYRDALESHAATAPSLRRPAGQSAPDHERAVRAAIDAWLARRVAALRGVTAFLLLTGSGRDVLIPVGQGPDWVVDGLDLTLLPLTETVAGPEDREEPEEESPGASPDGGPADGGGAPDATRDAPVEPPAPDAVGESERRELALLPERVRRVLFEVAGRRRPPRPDQYAVVLRIAAKLRAMTPAALDELAARTTGTTTEWAVLEDTVDRFLAQVRDRRAAAEERELMMVGLHDGLRPLYQRYRQLRGSVSEIVGVLGLLADAPVSTGSVRRDAEAALEADLRAAGFAGIAGFAAAIERWLTAYRSESVAVARTLLDRVAHVLDVAERRYRDPAQVAALHRDLAAARDRVADADRVIDEHVSSPGDSERAALDSALAGQKVHDAALGRLRDAVVALAGRHPLLGLPAFPHEELARTPQDGLPAFLAGYIAARRGDVGNVRGALAATPDVVFKLDALQTASQREQGIEPGSLLAEIVADRAVDVHVDEALVGVAVAVLAIALGLLTGGTGEAAVAPEVAAVAESGLAVATAADLGIGVASSTAAVADVALSGAMALADFRRYELESAAYGTGLLSDDPSFVWVIVSVVGVLASAHAAVTVFREFPALRGVARTFNGSRDVPALRAGLAEIAGLDARIAEAVARAAERAAADEVRSLELLAGWFPKDVLLASVGAESLVRVTLAAYRLAARGVRSFEVFLLEVRRTRLLGELSELGPAERALLERQYAQGLRFASRVQDHGRRLGLTPDQMEMFLRIWADEPGMTAEQLMVRMDEWVVTSGGTPAGFRAAPETVSPEIVSPETPPSKIAPPETVPPETGGEPPASVPAGTTSTVTDAAEAGPSIFVPDDETVEQWIGMWEREIEGLDPAAEDVAARRREFERRITNLRNRRSVLTEGPHRGRQAEAEIQNLYSSRQKRYHIAEGGEQKTTVPDATIGTTWAVEVKNWNIMYPTDAEMEAVARGLEPSKVRDLVRQVQQRREIFGNRQTVVVDLRGQLRLTGVTPAVFAHNSHLLHSFGRRLAELTGLPVEQIQIVVW